MHLPPHLATTLDHAQSYARQHRVKAMLDRLAAEDRAWSLNPLRQLLREGHRCLRVDGRFEPVPLVELTEGMLDRLCGVAS